MISPITPEQIEGLLLQFEKKDSFQIEAFWAEQRLRREVEFLLLEFYEPKEKRAVFTFDLLAQRWVAAGARFGIPLTNFPDHEKLSAILNKMFEGSVWIFWVDTSIPRQIFARTSPDQMRGWLRGPK